MEDITFDIGGILSDEEAEKFFEETENEQQEQNPDENENQPAEETEESEQENQNSESVGGEDENEEEEDAEKSSDDGSSPTVLSSMAAALKKDGIFPDFEDSEIAAVKTPEDFAELVDKAVSARMDAETRRVRELLNDGVPADSIKGYEQTLDYLNGITDEMLKAEGEEGDNLRKSLIYNDLIKKGYSDDRAKREVEKSFKATSEVDDAIDALAALKETFQKEYQQIQDEAKRKTEQAKAERKKQDEDFKKMVLESEIKIGEQKLDKRTCQKVYDAVMTPSFQDPNNPKRLLTAVQKFQKEQPLEFLKQLGLWYVLTDGGKNITSLTKKQVQAEKNKGIRELERKINSSSFSGGSLRYDGGNAGAGGDDILLSDDWKIA